MNLIICKCIELSLWKLFQIFEYNAFGYTKLTFYYLLLEFAAGMILPKKDNVKENILNITSGFNAKVSIGLIHVICVYIYICRR